MGGGPRLLLRRGTQPEGGFRRERAYGAYQGVLLGVNRGVQHADMEDDVAGLGMGVELEPAAEPPVALPVFRVAPGVGGCCGEIC